MTPDPLDTLISMFAHNEGDEATIRELARAHLAEHRDPWAGYAIEVPGPVTDEQAEAWRKALAREPRGPVILTDGARLRHRSEWRPQAVVAPPDFGQQTIGYEPTGWRAWIVPALGGLAFGAVFAVVVGLL